MYKLDFTQILKKLNVCKERRDNFILNLVNLPNKKIPAT